MDLLYIYLTLTLVVFEFFCILHILRLYINLTLTLVVFEFV